MDTGGKRMDRNFVRLGDQWLVEKDGLLLVVALPVPCRGLLCSNNRGRWYQHAADVSQE